jgi:uncharacterized protein YdeI (YjbR/CyaY-like superfamily)
MGDERETIFFASQADWEAWLEDHHQESTGIWMRMAKKASGIPSINYDEALEIALCFGWIDGQKDKWEEPYWIQRFTPRRPKSNWSKVNCEKVERLATEGKLRPAGLREVERAKADGRWEAAYASQRSIEVPDDLRLALEQHEPARLFFETLNKRNRYAILYRIQDAKKSETRAKRIQQTIEMLKEGKKLYP